MGSLGSTVRHEYMEKNWPVEAENARPDWGPFHQKGPSTVGVQEEDQEIFGEKKADRRQKSGRVVLKQKRGFRNR